MTKPEKTPSYLFGVRKTLALIAGVSSMAISATGAHAAGTLAGTDIINIAKATYDGPDGPVEVDSNPVTIKVDELLDVTVVSSDPGDIATDPAATAQVTTYQVTNSGNGEEAFTLTADTAKGGDEFDTTFEQIVLDTNGNGIYDPGVDTIYTPGTNDPVLKPDESVTVFILSTIPADAADGERAEIELSAVAITGSGVPGTTFAGAGDGGGDAVVGSTGADDEDSSFFVIQAAKITLVKSATVVDPFGGDQPVPGSTITYQLVATITGTGSLSNLAIADDVPADTTYVAESITLEGAGLSDAADADAGAFTSNAIGVALGTVPGGQTRTVTFKVTIN